MDWLTAWGVNNSIGFFFREILIELSRDGARDYTQVLFKDYIDSNLELATRTNLQIVTGQLIKEFLALFQQELEDAELSDQEITTYLEPIKAFIFNYDLQGILCNSLQSENFALDYSYLEQLWADLELLQLPVDFSWTRISKRFCRRVKFIWQQIEKPEIIDSIVNATSTVDIDLLEPVNQNYYQLIKYKKLIQDYYGNLRLDSLDTSGAAYDELKLWRIFIAQNVREVRDYIPQVYEIPKEHQKMLRESGQLEEEELTLKELEEYNQFYSQQPLRSVLEVVEDVEHQHIVILGDPGSGKSTLLQYIALQWAELPEQELSNACLPLLVELRSYNREKTTAQCHNLLEFFNSEISIISCLDNEYIQDKLNAGSITILFDGLDEVFEPSQREQVITEIIQFTQDYPKAKIIVTSRVIGYKQKTLAEENFTHFMLQDLDTAQVDDFINRWHDLTFYDRIDKARKRDRLKKAITESPAIQELSGNPLLLTMMAILNRNQELPRDRAELYNQSSRVLLHQWDTERALEDARLKPISLDYKDKQAMLRQVAYFMQANTKGLAGNSITAPDLKCLLSKYLATLSTTQDLKPDDIAEVLIHQLRTRNFILCFLGAEYYAFVHRTFLEYFCAWEFVWQFEKARTIDIEDLKQVFGTHWQDESWHEVLRLITGMIDSKFAGEIIEFLISREDKSGEYGNLLIAAKCLTEVRNRTAIQDIATKLLKSLKELVNSNIELNDWGEVLSAITYGWKDEPDTYNLIKEFAISNNNDDVRTFAVIELAKGWVDHRETYNIIKEFAGFDNYLLLRIIAIEELIKGWKYESKTYDLIKDLAAFEEQIVIKNKAIIELSKGWRDNSETYNIIKQLAIFDDRNVVRRTAIEELIDIWKDNPETYNTIKSSAISDNDNWIRRTAIKKLSEGWKDNSETYNTIKLSAISDNNYLVRMTAIEELSQGWRNNSETYNIIKLSAISDNNYWAKRTAIRELAKGWKYNQETYDVIKQSAISDINSEIRKMAIEELAEGWKEHPETYSIIKQAAVSDSHYNVRSRAIHELVKGWKDNPEVFEILCDRAINDPYKRESVFQTNPRQIALQIIVEQYKYRPEVLPLLRDRATNDPDEKVRKYAQEQLEK